MKINSWRSEERAVKLAFSYQSRRNCDVSLKLSSLLFNSFQLYLSLIFRALSSLCRYRLTYSDYVWSSSLFDPLWQESLFQSSLGKFKY